MRTTLSLLYQGRGGLPRQRSSQTETPPRGQTDSCENITLPETSFAGGKNTGDLTLWQNRCLKMQATDKSSLPVPFCSRDSFKATANKLSIYYRSSGSLDT